jgi:putative endonuclease
VHTTKQIGDAGEDLAADYLIGQGYEIMKRNHRNRWGEIDIIALDHDTLVFVEVKKKSTDRFGSPGEMITPKKIKKIKNTAENYLVDNNLKEVSWRIDAILLDGPHLDHLKNITN